MGVTQRYAGPAGAQCIARAALVLRVLSTFPEGARLTTIQDLARLSKGTTHRILATFVHEGFVVKTKRGQYELGPALYAMCGVRNGER